jgi:uncharacterized membrane protein
MEPLTIAGGLLGAFLNKLLPKTVLVVSLVVLLSFTAYETLKKAIHMYGAETQHAMHHAQQQHGSELTRLARTMDKEELDKEEECQVAALLDNSSNNDNDSNNEEEMEAMLSSQLELPHHQQQLSSSNDPQVQTKITTTTTTVFSSAVDLQNREDLLKILDEERHVPSGNVQILCLTLGVVVFINLIKGGGAMFPSPLGITCGSVAFWIANGLMILWTVVVIIFAPYLVRRCRSKARVRYPYVDGICTAAGFFVGMFGGARSCLPWECIPRY